MSRKPQTTRRVVVTGFGLRTALGDTPAGLFEALLEKRTAVRAQPAWATFDDFFALVAAPVEGFDAREIPRKFRRSMGRVAQLAVAASVDAVREAHLDGVIAQSDRFGVAIGSTLGSSAAEAAFWRHINEKNTARGLKATHFFQVMPHTCASNVAMYLQIRGEALATNAACASATRAIGTGLDRIRFGSADVVLAGGADELHESAAMTFDLIGGASRGFNDRPEQTPRPFD
ncbi:MAG: beta-ketoacyl-[acyl-carrier-protein] synthase family protein, partial [Deltaproteobacteria bacterium]|nr:beta-ketoacyl-[acyl-carrier-protein] synthase family protein [Deltaproteobacteria bacterium]